MAATPTVPVNTSSEAGHRQFRRFTVEVIAGDDAGARWQGDGETCTIGSQPDNDLVVTDATVSRYHCEISAAGGRFRVRDLGSRNGTRVGAVHITEASVASGAELRLGHTHLRVSSTDTQARIESTDASSFGQLVGESAVMRELFARLARAAAANATVLLEGETGTGKEGAAEALHANSPRAKGPLIVFDCGSVPANLIEAELFGHESGAFTGATGARAGAFEDASGGTLFLDEVGELALELQPKLLRALESRVVRRIGSRKEIACDVRVIAATNRDLRAEVNDGRFRSDLYYRLAVVRITLPPLRERDGDLALLSRTILSRLGASESEIAALTSTESLAQLARARWPGNVRELRNHLEQALVMADYSSGLGVPDESVEPAAGPATAPPIDASLPYDEARRRSIEAFERAYVDALLASHDGNVAQAARAASINRAYLYRLIKRYGLSR